MSHYKLVQQYIQSGEPTRAHKQTGQKRKRSGTETAPQTNRIVKPWTEQFQTDMKPLGQGPCSSSKGKLGERSGEPHQQALTPVENNTEDNDRAPSGKDNTGGNRERLNQAKKREASYYERNGTRYAETTTRPFKPKSPTHLVSYAPSKTSRSQCTWRSRRAAGLVHLCDHHSNNPLLGLAQIIATSEHSNLKPVRTAPHRISVSCPH